MINNRNRDSMRTDLATAEQNRSPLPNINGRENYNCWNPPEDFRPAWTETICGLASRCSKSTEKKLDFARAPGLAQSLPHAFRVGYLWNVLNGA